jgi:predicted PurR-regulated permease PerM
MVGESTGLDRKWKWFAAVLALGVLLYLLAPVLTPFAVAALFAYLGVSRAHFRWSSCFR